MWYSHPIKKNGSAEEQWISSATFQLVFTTLVITEERVIPLIMKSDSVYSPACFSFHAHSAQHVTFCCKLIIPAVIYLQCVHSWISQIIVINLSTSGGPPVWMCDGPAWTSSKLFPLVCSDKRRLHRYEKSTLTTMQCRLQFISSCISLSVRNKTNHHLFCIFDVRMSGTPPCCSEHIGYTMGCIDTRLCESLMKLFLPWNIPDD